MESAIADKEAWADGEARVRAGAGVRDDETLVRGEPSPRARTPRGGARCAGNTMASRSASAADLVLLRAAGTEGFSCEATSRGQVAFFRRVPGAEG